MVFLFSWFPSPVITFHPFIRQSIRIFAISHSHCINRWDFWSYLNRSSFNFFQFQPEFANMGSSWSEPQSAPVFYWLYILAENNIPPEFLVVIRDVHVFSGETVTSVRLAGSTACPAWLPAPNLSYHIWNAKSRSRSRKHHRTKLKDFYFALQSPIMKGHGEIWQNNQLAL